MATALNAQVLDQRIASAEHDAKWHEAVALFFAKQTHKLAERTDERAMRGMLRLGRLAVQAQKRANAARATARKLRKLRGF